MRNNVNLNQNDSFTLLDRHTKPNLKLEQKINIKPKKKLIKALNLNNISIKDLKPSSDTDRKKYSVSINSTRREIKPLNLNNESINLKTKNKYHRHTNSDTLLSFNVSKESSVGNINSLNITKKQGFKNTFNGKFLNSSILNNKTDKRKILLDTSSLFKNKFNKESLGNTTMNPSATVNNSFNRDNSINQPLNLSAIDIRDQSSQNVSKVMNNFLKTHRDKFNRKDAYSETFTNMLDMIDLHSDPTTSRLEKFMKQERYEDSKKEVDFDFEDDRVKAKFFKRHVLSHELKSGIPRIVDMLDSKFCFLYTECTEKRFPAYIITDLKDAFFTYYINFENIDKHQCVSTQKKVSEEKLVKSKPCSRIFERSHQRVNSLAHSKVDLTNHILTRPLTDREGYEKPQSKTPNKIITKNVPFEHFRRPSKFVSDITSHGNYIQINQPKVNGLTQECNYIVICVETEKPVRCSMCISYATDKSDGFKMHLKDDPFSDANKIKLFGSINRHKIHENVKKLKIERYKQIKDVLNKNIKIADDYAQHRGKTLEKITNGLQQNTINVFEKNRQNRKDDLDKKMIFSQRNEIIRIRTEKERINKENAQTLWMNLYSWELILNFYEKLEKIYILFKKRKEIRRQEEINQTKICLIQQHYRETFNLNSSKEERTNNILCWGLQQCAANMVNYSQKKIKNSINKFLSSVVSPWRLKLLSIQYIMIIKSIQIKFRKHMRKKKEYIAELENTWTSELIKLVEKESDYKEMGVNYNLENLEHMDATLRREICAHIIDRQLLEYIDQKYEVMEKVNDEKLEKKIGFLTSQEVESGKEIPQPRHSIFYNNDLPRKTDECMPIIKLNLNDSRMSQSRRSIFVQAETIQEVAETSNSNTKVTTAQHTQNRSQDFIKAISYRDIQINADNIQKLSHFSKSSQKIDTENLQNSEYNPSQHRIDKQKDCMTKQNARIESRTARRSVILTHISNLQESILPKMLYDEDCGNYEFSTVEMWHNLEDTLPADLYHKAKIKKEEILEAEKKFDLDKLEKSNSSPGRNKKKGVKEKQSTARKSQARKLKKSIQDKSEIQEEKDAMDNWDSAVEKLKLLPFKEGQKFVLNIDRDLIKSYIITAIEYSYELADLQKKEKLGQNN